MKCNKTCKNENCKSCSASPTHAKRENVSIFAPPKKDDNTPSFEESNKKLIDQFIQNISGQELLRYRFDKDLVSYSVIHTPCPCVFFGLAGIILEILS